MTRTNFWIGLAAVALVAAWILLTPTPAPIEYIQFEARDPWIVGNTDDAFAYAGEGVRTIQGTGTLQIDPESTTGMIEFTLQPDEALIALLGEGVPERSIMLRMRIERADNVWADRPVHGDTGIGDLRLPETNALHASCGSFELLIDGVRQSTGWQGFWSIGDALRQSDGSIRDQGLVFSPLLRDQSGFSDSDRTEFTLLIYDSPDSNEVILHLVFLDVRMIGG